MNRPIGLFFQGYKGFQAHLESLAQSRQTFYSSRVRVYVTGVGAVSSLGLGKSEFGAALARGQVAAAPVEHFDTSDLEREVACEVKGFSPEDHLTAQERARMGRCSQMAVAAARFAVSDAGLDQNDKLAGARTSVVIGTTMGEANLLGSLDRTWIHEGASAVERARIPRYGTTLLPIHVARAFGARGLVSTLPAACAAGNYAIGFARDLIASGHADRVICGASEVIEKLQYAGFVRLGAMAKDLCRPFDRDREGLLVGEGAGMLVLESERAVVERDATPLAEVLGYGLACDAYHITRPHPEGTGSKRALVDAIFRSGLSPKDVDFVNAHGTATPANDVVEAAVLEAVFGLDAENKVSPLVTSLKGMIGHCMGAASALEAVSCVLTLNDGIIPPTVNHAHTDDACSKLRLVQNKAKQADVKVLLNNSLAFGGYDAAVCFSKPDVAPPPSDRPGASSQPAPGIDL